jgi:hypothetical protein
VGANANAADSTAGSGADVGPGKTLTWVMFRRYDSPPDQSLMYIKRRRLLLF